jgi:hypothetical protein
MTTITPQQATEIGIEAYIYFYSIMTMEVTRRVMTNVPLGVKPGLGPMGEFSHFTAFPDADFKAVVRPNFDTLYSSAWLDLSKEPVIVSAPDTQGRYYLLPILDMWTDVFAVPGSRTSGTGAGAWALVAPGWTVRCRTGLIRSMRQPQRSGLSGAHRRMGPPITISFMAFRRASQRLRCHSGAERLNRSPLFTTPR